MFSTKFHCPRLLKWCSCRRCYSTPTLPATVTSWLEEMCDLLQPDVMHICDGSIDEREAMLHELMDTKVLVKCQKLTNCFVARSDPLDTGRDQKRVFTAAYNHHNFLTTQAATSCEGGCYPSGSLLGNYLSMTKVDNEINSRFFKSMKGRKMYVLPFILGPASGDTKLMGIQVTDNALIAVLTSLMVQSGIKAATEMLSAKITPQDNLCTDSFIKLIHASGCDPKSRSNWPSDREKYCIINMPEKKEIWSFGSSYWENALLVKKGAALQLAAHIGREENFMAVNMSVMSVKTPCRTVYIGLMGPTGSGKSVMASITGQATPCPLNAQLVSEDVTWIKLNTNTGILHAINPECGILPILKDVNNCNTPMLNSVVCENSILLNSAVAGTDTPWWEGIELPDKDYHEITDWRGRAWRPEGPRAAHIDARFCNSVMNMANLDKMWDSGQGVPLSAILVLTRRNEGHPLILETSCWTQGVFHMAAIRTRYHNQSLDSEDVYWDPMGCRPYLGYNVGKMLDNWMTLSTIKDIKLPRVYLVNLFLKDNWMKDHMWIGYEHNASILQWVLDRLDCKAFGEECPMGVLPCEGEFHMPSRQLYTFGSMVKFDSNFWQCEVNKFEELLQTQLPEDIPELLSNELHYLKGKLTPCPCVPCC